MRRIASPSNPPTERTVNLSFRSDAGWGMVSVVQSRRRNAERDVYSWYDNRGNYWSGRAYVDAYYLRVR